MECSRHWKDAEDEFTVQFIRSNVFFCGLSHLVSPEEPLVGLTLKGLSHKSSEPWTVFAWRFQQLEKIGKKQQHSVSGDNAHLLQVLKVVWATVKCSFHTLKHWVILARRVHG